MSTQARDRMRSSLAGAGWLGGCDDRLRAAILAASEPREVPDGATIVPAYAAEPGLFGVVRGHVALERHAAPPRLVDLRRADFWCGRTALIVATPLPIAVRARGSVALRVLAAAHVAALFEAEPASRPAFADLVARHADVLVQQLDVVMTPNPLARVARRLVASFEIADSGVLPLTQGELAQLTCLSRSTIHRVLGELECRGALRAGYRHLVVADTAALLEASGWHGPDDIATPADLGAEADRSTAA